MKRPAIAVLVALVLTAGAACKSKGSGEQPAGGQKGGGRRGGGAGLVYPVDVLKLEAKRVDYVVNAPGTVEAFERVQVTARVAGAVDKVAFTEGAQVKKGEVLVVIDSQRYRLAVNSARAALEKAEAAQKDVEAMIARREGASEKNPGLIPGEELATFRTKGLTAKADTQVAKEGLKTAQLSLRDSAVRAPMDGIIQTRTVETGQYVQAGYVMATILNNDPMLLRFGVSPQDAPRIKPGMTVEFKLRESQRIYTAKVTLVAGAAEEATRMVQITAQVVDEGHKFWLRPGAFCDVTLTIPATRDAVVAPRLAVRPSERGFVGFVVKDGVAEERVLQLGSNTRDGWVEIRDGLAPGESLVVRGGEPLVNGSKVRANTITPQDLAKNAAEPAGSAAPGGSDAPAPGPAPSGSRGSGEGRRRGPRPAESAAP